LLMGLRLTLHLKGAELGSECDCIGRVGPVTVGRVNSIRDLSKVPTGTESPHTSKLILLTAAVAVQASQSLFVITVTNQLLVAIIDGGSTLTIPATAPVSISAAASYDPDAAGPIEASAAGDALLGFSWSCRVFDGAVSNQCRNASGGPLPLQQAPRLFLPAGTLLPCDWPYVFTVIVSKPGRAQATASLPVTVVAGAALVVSMSSVCWQHAADQTPCCAAADGTTVANADSRLLFAAAVDDDANATFGWSVGPPLPPEEAAAVAPIGYRGGQFVLQGSESALIAGNRYTVTVAAVAGGSDGTQGAGSRALVINAPPTGGSFSACLLPAGGAAVDQGDGLACERTGEAVVDSFRLVCANWADPDGDPFLSYRYGYMPLPLLHDPDAAAAADASAAAEAGAAGKGGGNGTVWLDWAPDAVRDVILPGGELLLLAQVPLFTRPILTPAL
jgi:hypothetical protein